MRLTYGFRPALRCALVLLAFAPGAALADKPAASKGVATLRQLDGALAELVAKVSPSVVQVLVSGYGPVGEPQRDLAAPLARQHGIGSGVVVDAAGFILTNYHVVHGAQRIVVVLPIPSGERLDRPDSTRRRTLEAKLVGSDRAVDLALLKVEPAAPLPAFSLEGQVQVRQGELVFAIGSPQGLASTVTMGVISSTSRDVQLEAPVAFIQTDAPINPGNSGGALVNSEGALVGINTFILSQAGGSQGLGFAIPIPIARLVYSSLRKHGRLRRAEAGLSAQLITPTLASGLKLARDWGVLVSDVSAGTPAAIAGIRPGDIIDAVDGHPIESLAELLTQLYVHPIDQPLRVVALRGDKKVELQLGVSEAKRPVEDLIDLATPDKHLVRRLGILGLTVDEKLAGLVQLREASGVVVAARTLDGTSVESGLQVGDVIHAFNDTKVESLEKLRELIRASRPRDAVVLQVERQAIFHYLAFDME